MSKTSSVHKLVASAASGSKQLPVLQAVRSDPENAAMMSKLVESQDRPQYDKAGNRTIETPRTNALRELSRRNASRTVDARHIISMLPDVELAKQILISSILSPSDMITTSITFQSDDSLFMSDLHSALLSTVQGFFEENYDFKKKLPEVLESVLFDHGSYPVAVIPENAVDEFINGHLDSGLESSVLRSTLFTESGDLAGLGILSGPLEYASETIGLETFQAIVNRRIRPESPSAINGLNHSKVSVTDNFNLLKLPRLEAAQRNQHTDQLFRAGLESARTFKASDRELERLLYRNRRNQSQAIRSIKTQDQLQRTSVTEPLVMTLPPWSVIPVFVPGDESKHVGYYVLLDRGYPVAIEEAMRYGGSLLGQYQGTSFVSSLIRQARAGFDGELDCGNRMHQDLILKTYSDIMSADLMARVRNSGYGATARLATNQEAFRIMLARDMEGTQTQVLFLPASAVTYFAMEYDEFGMGVSLLKKYATIAMLRSVLLFANVKASLRNSVGRVKVDVDIDEDEIDPLRRAEEIIGEFMATRQAPMPGTMMDAYDTASYVERSAYEMNFRHPKLPTLDIDVSEVASSHVQPDEDLARALREQHHMGFGLTSDLIDQVNQPEHATSVVNRSVMLAKRVMVSQEKINPLISQHYRQYAYASSDLIHEINALLHAKFDSIILTDELRKRAAQSPEQKDRIIGFMTEAFMNSLTATLPSPDTTSVENQLDVLKNYEELLDIELDNYMSDQIYDEDFAGELGNKLEAYRGIVKSHFMKLKLSSMGVDSGISEFFLNLGDDVSVNSVLSEHAGQVSKTITLFGQHLEKIKALREASNRAAESLDVSGGSMGSSSYDSGSSDGMSDAGDDDFDSAFDTGPDDPVDSDQSDGLDVEDLDKLTNMN